MINNKIIEFYNKYFWDFISDYDTSNSNILRKVVHSYSVAEKCYKIGCYLKLNQDDRNFCYLMGLLHDIGRFEQWKIYGTYNDKASKDHGDIGADILSRINAKVFKISSTRKKVMIEAIKWHTKPYHGKNKDVIFFNQIINNADAYSNVIAMSYGVKPINAKDDGVTNEILNDFLNQKPLLRYFPKTKLDSILMQTACAYYVKFDYIRREIVNMKYIDIIYETFLMHLNESDRKIYKMAMDTLKSKYIC